MTEARYPSENVSRYPCIANLEEIVSRNSTRIMRSLSAVLNVLEHRMKRSCAKTVDLLTRLRTVFAWMHNRVIVSSRECFSRMFLTSLPSVTEVASQLGSIDLAVR